MTTSSDLIEALLRRRRRSLRPETAVGAFPEGWSTWLDAQAARPGRVSGAAAPRIVDVFLARQPRLPATVVAELGRWRAFASLWRQEWHPAGRDERALRVFAMAVSGVLHIVFIVVLSWLMYARFFLLVEEGARGERVVQVEFIGDGTPADAAAGGAAGAPQERNARAAPASAAAASEQSPVPLPEPASSPDAASPTDALAASQPLRVTETPEPDSDFVLPPTRVVAVATPEVAMPEVSARPRTIEILEAPRLTPLEAELPRREIAVPDRQQRAIDVTVREVPAPLPSIRARPVPVPQVPLPEIGARAPAVGVRDLPMPPAPAAAAAGDSGNPAEARGAGPPQAASATPPGTRSPTGAAPGSGPGTTSRPGGAPGPRVADDWGASTRNRPGGEAGQAGSGLFNPDGSPRLAAGSGRSGGGLPPGTITEDYDRIDRMGTWLKRPPIGYEPTAFDRFWVPHESLLQEWVRRSIKEVLIPIPGTSKTIRCAVALLALGGACGISDPNLRDVEVDARKAPEVPFKPELQEDQESLRSPPGAP